MICVFCKRGEPTPRMTSATFEREGVTVIIKNVPARVCPECGESYFDAATTDRLLALVREAARVGRAVEVREYIAA